MSFLTSKGSNLILLFKAFPASENSTSSEVCYSYQVEHQYQFQEHHLNKEEIFGSWLELLEQSRALGLCKDCLIDDSNLCQRNECLH